MNTREMHNGGTVSHDVIHNPEFAKSEPGFDKSLQTLGIWQKLKDAGTATRIHLDPLDFPPKVLPHLVILEVLGPPLDFRWRLFGGAHQREYGINLTGRTLSEMRGQGADTGEVELVFRTCVETREPVFHQIRYANRIGVKRACRGVILPLFDRTGSQVTHLLGCSEWLSR